MVCQGVGDGVSDGVGRGSEEPQELAWGWGGV